MNIGKPPISGLFVTLSTLLLVTTACSTPPTTTSEPPAETDLPVLSAEGIAVDGSSTVFPITEAIAQAYQKEADEEIQINVSFSGTGGGFQRFCAGETDINDASRPISTKEMELCRINGVRFIELPVAFDALTIVVNSQNDWATEITVEELRRMWEPAAQRQINTWQQVRSDWPDRPLNLYGPGPDSGTFDYFVESILENTDTTRSDYSASEDDDLLVRSISEDANALGFFGFAYYEQNQDRLNALAVDNGNGPVLPSRDTVENVEYQPLSRPLFIYVNAQAVQEKDMLQDFVEFYLENADQFVAEVGYVPLPQDGYEIIQRHFYRGKIGTVYEGQPQPNLTISEVLTKQAEF
jgi:phosphate transport system substrate-binding protein